MADKKQKRYLFQKILYLFLAKYKLRSLKVGNTKTTEELHRKHANDFLANTSSLSCKRLIYINLIFVVGKKTYLDLRVNNRGCAQSSRFDTHSTLLEDPHAGFYIPDCRIKILILFANTAAYIFQTKFSTSEVI
jgi:hypothetical protein